MKKYSAELISFGLLVCGIGLSLGNVVWFQTGIVRLVWYLVAFIPVGFPVLKEVVERLREREYFNEFMLMSLAAIGAFYIGEYPEGVAVMLFYSIGEKFQDSAVSRARSNIRSLLDVRPERATVIRDGHDVIEKPERISVGEIIEIKVGERVPLDGTMLGDVAAFNTAALTGESVPRNIRTGETVLAGMIVTDRVVRVKVTKSYNQSALARILEMVQNASERKAPAELFIRKFARVYTPVVSGLAVLIVLIPWIVSWVQPDFSFMLNDWLYRALVFLVISCPCALVVSIPLGYFGGIGAASRQGILFKGGNYLDAITKINTVIFDKTGTLTKGVFEVQQVWVRDGFTEEEVIRIIASVESRSNHPIAKAIGQYANSRQVAIRRDMEVFELAGYGLKAFIDGKEVLVGNARLLDKYGISFPSELTKVSETLVACAVNGVYVGHLLLADTVKEDAKEAGAALKRLNIDNIQILSGDKQTIVSKLAGYLGVDEAYGDLLPEGKVAHVETLKSDSERRVAFVGDGINDAPVLALSDVGVAMGGLGSDAAIEIADVVLQTDQPSRLAMAIRIGKETRRIIWQNITLAFGVKLIVLILGAGGLATMWEAVFADVGVALLAILNAIRIQRRVR
ncbi:heavy metal translocating P-type ATPase [Butyricimonas faecalis]|uniref:heavy metal translocating P-type ATPase n=1 Tax=Butyricimonas faecalis TaxID=2093856 RepID=UPI000D0FFD57|nr:heavy metal translocating P-type ATPase [Butyricimonas faecalis]